MQMFSSRCVFVSLLLTFLSVSASAQKGGGLGRPGGNVGATVPSARASAPQSTENAFELYDVTRPPTAAQRQARNEEPPCFHWPLNPILSATVSVAAIKTPEQAREDFVQGCEAVRKNDLTEAQKRLERAVKLDPQFAPAWVLLGQTERERKKPDKAAESCTHARSADPTYLPAYLCLADVAAHQEQWKQVAELTNQAAALHPVRAPGAFYYNSLANFYLQQLPAAEASGLRAIDESSGEQKAQMHFLLAKIYEQKGDRSAEAVQLRKFIELAPHGPEADAARKILNQIEKKNE
jgi:tetratricopeptide (TPR) repeat protein